MVRRARTAPWGVARPLAALVAAHVALSTVVALAAAPAQVAAQAAPPPTPKTPRPPAPIRLEDTPYFKHQRADALLSEAQALLDARWSEALSLIQQAVALDDSRALTHWKAARLYAEADVTASALDHLRRYLALQPDPDEPDWPDAHLLAARLHLRQYADPAAPTEQSAPHLTSAERHLRAAYFALLSQPPPGPLLAEVEHQLALTLLWQRQLPASLRYLRAARLHSATVEDSLLRFEALLLRLLDQPAQAVAVMEQAKLPPDALYQRALTYADLDDLIANLTTLAYAYADLHQHALALQLIQPTRAWLEAEHTLAPTPQTAALLGTLYSTLASLADARQDSPEAERFYREALKLQPNDPAALNNLAWTLTLSAAPIPAATADDLSRLHEALDLATRAVALLPTATAFDTLSEACLRLGRFPEAADANRRALLSHPADPYLRAQQQRIRAADPTTPPAPDAATAHRRLSLWRPPTHPSLL